MNGTIPLFPLYAFMPCILYNLVVNSNGTLLGKWYLVKHNCVPVGVVSDYNGQLHVSACTGHLQIVLGERGRNMWLPIIVTKYTY